MPLQIYKPGKEALAAVTGNNSLISKVSQLKFRALAKKMGVTLPKGTEFRAAMRGGSYVPAISKGAAPELAALGPVQAAHEIGHLKNHGLISKLTGWSPLKTATVLSDLKKIPIVGKLFVLADEAAASAQGYKAIKKVYGKEVARDAKGMYSWGLKSHLGLTKADGLREELLPYRKSDFVKGFWDANFR